MLDKYYQVTQKSSKEEKGELLRLLPSTHFSASCLALCEDALNYSVFNGLLPIFFFFFPSVISPDLTFVGSTQDLGKPRRFGSAVYMRLVTDGRTLFLMRSCSTMSLQQQSAHKACSEPKVTAVGQPQVDTREKQEPWGG